MFNLFCKHEWEEDERFYAPPSNALSSLRGMGDIEELVREMLFGITTIKMKCIHCGWIKTVKILGKKIEDD